MAKNPSLHKILVMDTGAPESEASVVWQGEVILDESSVPVAQFWAGVAYQKAVQEKKASEISPARAKIQIRPFA